METAKTAGLSYFLKDREKNEDVDIESEKVAFENALKTMEEEKKRKEIEKQNIPFIMTKGAAAAHIRSKSSKDNSVITVDWTFDGIYFSYDNREIVISIGPKTVKNEIHQIDTPHKKTTFIELANYAIKNLTNYSIASDNALRELQKCVNALSDAIH